MMENSDFINNLFKKYELSKEEDKEKVSDIIEEIDNKKKEDTKVEKLITSFFSRVDLAEQLIEVMPIYYDDSGIWWRWIFIDNKWDIIDEVDLMNIVTNSSSANTINSKERGEILQALKQVSRKYKPLIVPKTWIQFQKEVVDIETGDRFEANRNYFFTCPLPFKIGKNEETPIIDKVFSEWVGCEYVLQLKQIMAYCMFKDYPLERIFCFYGAGSNGKSCFLSLLRKFLGDENITSTDLYLLTSSRFETAKLRNKLACMMGEIDFNVLEKTQILKRLVSGKDPISLEYKNKGSLDYINYAKIIMATNNIPDTTDKTDGWYRRWIIIDFPNRFTEKKDILAEIPKVEYENLSLQLIGILIDLLKNREFDKEGSLEDRKKKYEDHSNPLDKFWKENINEDFDSSIFKHDFRKKLSDFCKENRFREISDRTISKFMEEKNIKTSQKYATWTDDSGKTPFLRVWNGINWKN